MNKYIEITLIAIPDEEADQISVIYPKNDGSGLDCICATGKDLPQAILSFAEMLNAVRDKFPEDFNLNKLEIKKSEV